MIFLSITAIFAFCIIKVGACSLYNGQIPIAIPFEILKAKCLIENSAICKEIASYDTTRNSVLNPFNVLKLMVSSVEENLFYLGPIEGFIIGKHPFIDHEQVELVYEFLNMVKSSNVFPYDLTKAIQIGRDQEREFSKAKAAEPDHVQRKFLLSLCFRTGSFALYDDQRRLRMYKAFCRLYFYEAMNLYEKLACEYYSASNRSDLISKVALIDAYWVKVHLEGKTGINTIMECTGSKSWRAWIDDFETRTVEVNDLINQLEQFPVYKQYKVLEHLHVYFDNMAVNDGKMLKQFVDCLDHSKLQKAMLLSLNHLSFVSKLLLAFCERANRPSYVRECAQVLAINSAQGLSKLQMDRFINVLMSKTFKRALLEKLVIVDSSPIVEVKINWRLFMVRSSYLNDNDMMMAVCSVLLPYLGSLKFILKRTDVHSFLVTL